MIVFSSGSKMQSRTGGQRAMAALLLVVVMGLCSQIAEGFAPMPLALPRAGMRLRYIFMLSVCACKAWIA